MKMPDLLNMEANKIPEAYQLRLADVAAAMALTGMTGIPLTDEFYKVLNGMYKWGFTRGQRYEQSRQEAK